MAFLNAYFDRSSDKENLITVVGGVVSTVEKWNEFNKEWAGMLNDADLPFFHMTDFESRTGKYTGKYKDWTDEKRHEVFNRALGLLCALVDFFPAVSIENEEFQSEKNGRLTSLSSDELKAMFKRLEPRHLCSEKSTAFILRYAAEKGFEKKFSLSFDQGEKILSDAVPLSNFEKVYSDVKVAVEDKKTALPLQGADIIAYEVMKDIINSSKADYKMRYPLDFLLKEGRFKYLHCGPDKIADYFDAWIEYWEAMRRSSFPRTSS